MVDANYSTTTPDDAEELRRAVEFQGRAQELRSRIEDAQRVLQYLNAEMLNLLNEEVEASGGRMTLEQVRNSVFQPEVELERMAPGLVDKLDAILGQA